MTINGLPVLPRHALVTGQRLTEHYCLGLDTVAVAVQKRSSKLLPFSIHMIGRVHILPLGSYCNYVQYCAANIHVNFFGPYRASTQIPLLSYKLFSSFSTVTVLATRPPLEGDKDSFDSPGNAISMDAKRRMTEKDVHQQTGQAITRSFSPTLRHILYPSESTTVATAPSQDNHHRQSLHGAIIPPLLVLKTTAEFYKNTTWASECQSHSMHTGCLMTVVCNESHMMAIFHQVGPFQATLPNSLLPSQATHRLLK